MQNRLESSSDSPISNGLGGMNDNDKYTTNNDHVKVNFRDEIRSIDYPRSSSHFELEKCPMSLPRQPYWTLRVIRISVISGGYLTPNIYIPKSVWYQLNAKYAGLSFKIAAFEQLYALLTANIVPLERPTSIEGLQSVLRVFIQFSDALLTIQNNLSKPFPFIHEVDEPIVDSKLSSQSQKGRISNFIGSLGTLGKNVRKFAEVGYSRLGTVIPTVASDLELSHYTSLLAEVCNQSQLLDDWFQYVEQQRVVLADRRLTGKSSAKDSLHADLLSALMTEQHNVSTFMREVVCELLLREVEQLLSQYLKAMCDTFTTLPWEQPDGAAAPDTTSPHPETG